MSEQTDKDRQSPRPATRPPLWAIALVTISVLLMGAGVALPIMLGQDVEPQRSITGDLPEGGGRAGDLAPGLAPNGRSPGTLPDGTDPTATDPEAAAEPEGIVALSPAIFRLGFSFFVGFAIAYAMRVFMKFAIAALGFFFLALFGLQYSGLIVVQWGLMEARYTELTGDLERTVSSAKEYIVLYLPSAASATAGMIAGLMRRKG